MKRGIPACPLLRPFTFSETLRIGDDARIQRAEAQQSPRPGHALPHTPVSSAHSPSGVSSNGPRATSFGRFSSCHQAAGQLAELLSDVCLFDPALEGPVPPGGDRVWRAAALEYWHGTFVREPDVPAAAATARELTQMIADLRRGELPAGLDFLGAFYLARRLPAQLTVTRAMLSAGFQDSLIAQTVSLPEGWINCYRRTFGQSHHQQFSNVRDDQVRWTKLAEFLGRVAEEGSWRMSRVLHYLEQRSHLRILGMRTQTAYGDLALREFLAYEIAWQTLWSSPEDQEVTEALEDLRRKLARPDRRGDEPESTGASDEAIQLMKQSIMGRPDA